MHDIWQIKLLLNMKIFMWQLMRDKIHSERACVCSELFFSSFLI
uniref:Uncharacterized protein n=1 Tax=Arundo donax TaxID=35708 RepID=A0A0A9F5B3_ARUDO